MSPPDSAATIAGDSIIAWRDLRVRRPNGFAVECADLSIGAGETVAIVGASGCGKTTLLWGLVGLLPAVQVRVSGQRRYLGRPWPEPDTAGWRELMAGPVTIVMQDAKAALDPLQRIGVQVATITRSTDDRVLSALGRAGLAAPRRIAAAWPHQVSGGQAQKVLVAIALLRAPRLLVLDEPTASLDGASIDEFVGHLHHLQQQHGTAVLIATHDMALVAALRARVFRHDGGAFVPSALAENRVARRDPPAPEVELLAVRGLEKSFGSQSVLRRVDLTVRRCEVVAVVGPSGCGKTTLARLLAGHLVPDAGEIHGATGVRGSQMLAQDAYATLTPGRCIRGLLAETARREFDAEREAKALGLGPEHLDKTADQLSGGERRRVALLRALSVRPELLILDEPTASLDRGAAVAVMQQLMEIQRSRGLACLWITHDQELAVAFAHRILHLRDGRLS